jgi:hypothetical protein
MSVTAIEHDIELIKWHWTSFFKPERYNHRSRAKCGNGERKSRLKEDRLTPNSANSY